MAQWQKEVERLEKLYKSDAGFFTIGLHSWIESYIKKKLCLYDTASCKLEFPKIIGMFKNKLFDDCASNSNLKRPDPKIFGDIIRDHHLTNEVRHEFVLPLEDDVIAVTSNFLRFIRSVPELYACHDFKKLESILKPWVEHRAQRLDYGDEFQREKENYLESIKQKESALHILEEQLEIQKKIFEESQQRSKNKNKEGT